MSFREFLETNENIEDQRELKWSKLVYVQRSYMPASKLQFTTNITKAITKFE